MDKVKENASKAFSAGLGKVSHLIRTKLISALKKSKDNLLNRVAGELHGWLLLGQ